MWLVLACLVAASGLWLRATLPPVRERTPDEQTYATFAAGFDEVGFGRYADVVRNFGADPSLAQLPPPTRVGYLWLAVAAMRMTADRTAASLALLSALASMLILVGTTFAAWRWPGPPVAVIAALLLAASPLDLAIARRAWQDDVFALVGVAMAAALAVRAAGMASRKGLSGAAPALAFFAFAAFALLIKEAALPLLVLGSLLLAWIAWREGGARAVLPVAVGFALTVAAVVGLLSVLCGGWETLARTWTGLIRGQDTNEYVRRYQSGGPLYYVRGLLILQPVAAILGALGTVLALARPAWMVPGSAPARRAVAALAAWCAGFALFTACWPLKSLRFMSPIFAPAAVLGALAVVAGMRALRTRLPGPVFRVAVAVVAMALLVAAWGDLARFHDFFIRRGIPDLATPWFTAPR